MPRRRPYQGFLLERKWRQCHEWYTTDIGCLRNSSYGGVQECLSVHQAAHEFPLLLKDSGYLHLLVVVMVEDFS